MMLVRAALAQEHLTPEPGILAQLDEYEAKIRKVFAGAYTGDVVLRVFILASFNPEEAAGIRKTDKGYTAFAMTPSSTIWDTELVRMQESGQITTFDKDGKQVPPGKNNSFQKLKKKTPADIRKITARIEDAALPTPLAERIARVWQNMLLDAQHPKQPPLGADGTTYHFSMWVQSHGIVSGTVWSPDEGSGTFALTNLASALAQYAKGHLDSEQLAEALKPLE